MSELSEHSKNILGKVGWAEGRRVDTARYEAALEAEGFEVFRAVKRFLSEFGGLYVPHIRTIRGFSSEHVLIIDPLRATLEVFADHIEWIAQAVSEELCLVGEFDGVLSPMMMSRSGSILTHDGAVIYRFGREAYESLDNILSNREGEVIYKW